VRIYIDGMFYRLSGIAVAMKHPVCAAGNEGCFKGPHRRTERSEGGVYPAISFRQIGGPVRRVRAPFVWRFLPEGLAHLCIFTEADILFFPNFTFHSS